MQIILYYDSHPNRRRKNSAFFELELNGLSLLGVEKVKDFDGHPGAETLISNEKYAGFLINTLDPAYIGVLETAVLKQMEEGSEQHSNIILLGSKSNLENHVRNYGVQVINTPNGYLQNHHLPQVREALQNIIQG